MAYKQLILVKNAGENIPTGVLENILKEYNTCFGAAFGMNDTLCTTKQEFKTDNFTLKDFEDLQAEFSDVDIAMTFGAYDEAGYSQNALQPFTLVEDEAAVFLSGSFEDERDSKSRESAEWQAFTNYLKPKLESAYKAGGNDVEFIAAAVNDTIGAKEIAKFLKPDGNFAVVLKNGSIETFWNQSTMLQFPWGTISDGSVVSSKTEEKVEEKKPASKFGSLFKLGGKEKQAPTKDVETKKVETASTENVADMKVVSTKRMVKAPDNLGSNKAIRNYYNKNAGFCPKNWKERPTVESRLTKDLKDLAIVNKPTTPKMNTVPDVTPEEKKDIEPKHVPEPDPDVELPHVPAADRKAIVEKFLKKGTVHRAIAEGRENILNPYAMKNLESEMPTFAEQVGLKSMHDLLGFSYEDFREFCAEFPKSAPVVLHSMRNEMLKMLQEERSSTDNKSDSTEEPKAETTPKSKFKFSMGKNRAAM